MKNVLLTVLLAVITLGLSAQKLDKAKDLWKGYKPGDADKLTAAKTEIDGVLANEKNQGSSEAWYYKCKIYLAISQEDKLKASNPDARDVSFDALKKYMDLESKEKDQSKKNLLLTIDQNKPFSDIYAGFSKDAASFYNAGNFNDALTNFKKCLDVFNFMAERSMTLTKLDTTITLYAGISAEKANKLDEAATYYGTIAEHKAKGEGFAEIYKWLADHYKKKNDVANAQKFTALGEEVYPKDPFWVSFDLELLHDQGTKDQLFEKYREIIRDNPDNNLYLFNYGVELYNAGYDPDIKKRPANSMELIKRAADTLELSIAKKSDYPNAHMVLGQLYYNQGVDYNTENKDIKRVGDVKLTPEQLKKKEDLRVQVVKKFDAATPHFEKVDSLLDPQGKLKMEEKEILKNALDLLITINEEKIAQLQNKKSQAEIKKDMGTAKSAEAEIKVLEDKNAKFTDKFNNVDRKHS